MLYFILGVVGGLLPDIDSDTSISVRLFFTFIAIIISFFVIFEQQTDGTIIELLLLWAGSFVFIKYFLFSIFIKLTVHRGIIHSIPASVLFGFITTIVIHRIFKFNTFVAWMSGIFVFWGCIIHLLLDEICSLNINGLKPKKSAGTALKFWNPDSLKSTIFTYFAIVLLFTITPETKQFYLRIIDMQTYRNLEFFPKEKWFARLYSEIKSELKNKGILFENRNWKSMLISIHTSSK